MRNLRILNTREKKEIYSLMGQQWGFSQKIDYVFLINPKSKIYLVNRDFARINTEKLRIDSVGLYFGELKKEGLRLSIEGSQIIGPKCTKNIVELSKQEMRLWLKGIDLEKMTESEGFALIKHGKDYLGTGKVKEGNILNFVPKTRRIMAED
ncbi:hypothetical protein KY339_03520 [Candidatus Woesearchaeota archaeon]|nr:hypothetical protein [Candidatus Woesearchaeota archaeon]